MTKISLSPHMRGSIFILICSILWSFGGVGIKLVDAPPLTVAGLRSFFALPILLFVFISQIKKHSFTEYISNLKNHTFVLTSVFYAATLMLFVTANKHTTAANAIFLQNTAPIYVAILSWFIFRERLNKYDYFGFLGCFLGLFLFFKDSINTHQGMFGIIIALSSGVMYAFNTVFLVLLSRKSYTPPIDSALIAMLAIIVGNILVFVISLPSIINYPPTSLTSIASVASLGVVQIGLSYAFYIKGIKHVSAFKIVILGFIEPALNPLWVALVTGEVPTMLALLGGFIILISAYITMRYDTQYLANNIIANVDKSFLK